MRGLFDRGTEVAGKNIQTLKEEEKENENRYAASNVRPRNLRRCSMFPDIQSHKKSFEITHLASKTDISLKRNRVAL